MAAKDVSTLLRLIENAHQHLREENHKLLLENERLNNLLNGKVVGQEQKELTHADASASSLPSGPSEALQLSSISLQQENIEVEAACTNDGSLIGADSKEPEMKSIEVEAACTNDGALIGADSKIITCSQTVTGESVHLASSHISLAQPVTDDIFWYVGKWIDLTGSFFEGCTVNIGKDGWKPREPLNSRGSGAKYSVSRDKDSLTISMVEHRTDGSKRVYKGIPGPMNLYRKSMIVSLEGDRTLTWTLHTKDITERNLNVSRISSLRSEEQHSQRRFDIGCVSARLGYFKLAMGVIIIGTLISIGVEIELDLPGRTASAEVLNALRVFNIFSVAAFIVEILISYHWEASFGYLAKNMLVTALQALSEFLPLVTNQKYLLLKCVVLVRCYRLLRVSRFFQNEFMDTVRVCWRLLSGLKSTVTTVIAMLVLVLMMLFVFSCIGCEVITKYPGLKNGMSQEEWTYVSAAFDGVFPSMLTLFQFVTLDSVSVFYVPLIKARPLLALYFLSIVLTVSISLMNMVTGVIVDKAMSRAKSDRRQKRQELMRKVQTELPEFTEIFAIIPTQLPGIVRKQEFENMQTQLMPDMFRRSLEELDILSMAELFDLLDVDESNELTEDEFVHGMLNLRLANLQEQHQLHFIHEHARTTVRKTKMLERLLCDVQSSQVQLREAMAELRASMLMSVADNRVANPNKTTI